MPQPDSYSSFGTFEKIDAAERMVFGYASTPDEDNQHDIVPHEAMKAAWPDYSVWNNVRLMHRPEPVGVVKAHRFDERGTWIAAKVVDDDAWNKVREGVLKGFSIGGKVLERHGKIIKRLMLSEISLVDRPANPNAKIELFKLYDDKEPTMIEDQKPEGNAEAKDDDVQKTDGVAKADENALAKVDGALGKVDGAIAKVEGAIAKVDAVEIRVDTALAKAEGRLAKTEGELAKVTGELAKVSALLQKALDLPADDGAAVTSVAKTDDVQKGTGIEPEKPLDPTDTAGHMAKALANPGIIGFAKLS